MTRTAPGILLAAAWLLLLIYGSFQLFWAVVLLIGFIGGREYCRMALEGQLYEPDRIILPALMILPVAAALFSRQQEHAAAFGFLLGLLGLIGYLLYHYRRFEPPLALLYRGVLGLVIIGFFGSHLILIRGLADGAHWLIILSAVTAGTDTGAYLVGSAWGKRKLCPHISPNKTVEGALGGLAGGVIMALLLALVFTVQSSIIGIGIIALALSIGSMVGDLLESIIKRGCGVKDSGTILGGHGGVLDRLDSMLLAGPLLYYILILLDF
jgi:phosphatidate cytidylyltransferase